MGCCLYSWCIYQPHPWRQGVREVKPFAPRCILYWVAAFFCFRQEMRKESSVISPLFSSWTWEKKFWGIRFFILKHTVSLCVLEIHFKQATGSIDQLSEPGHRHNPTTQNTCSRFQAGTVSTCTISFISEKSVVRKRERKGQSMTINHEQLWGDCQGWCLLAKVTVFNGGWKCTCLLLA